MKQSQWSARALTLVLALMLMLTLFGCQSQNAGTTATTTTTAAVTTTTKAAAAQKTIAVSIVGADGTSKAVTIKTDAENLRGALEQEKLIAGDESQYGLFVKTVDGVTADDSKQEWWCFTKGGESLSTGVDSTPIADGEQFEITLKTGY